MSHATRTQRPTSAMSSNQFAGTKRSSDDISATDYREKVGPKSKSYSLMYRKGPRMISPNERTTKRLRFNIDNNAATTDAISLQAEGRSIRSVEDNNEDEMEDALLQKSTRFPGSKKTSRVIRAPPKACSKKNSHHVLLGVDNDVDANDGPSYLAQVTGAPHGNSGIYHIQAVAAATAVRPLVSIQPTTMQDMGILSPSEANTDVFTVPLPDRVTPWPFSYDQATLQFTEDIPCPINWSALPAMAKQLEPKHICAYEARRPWTLDPVSFKDVIKAVLALTGKEYAEEGVRKLFRKANLAVYNATGVYFIRSSIGLYEDHGIPTDTEMTKQLEKAGYSRKKALKAAKTSCKSDAAGPTDDGPLKHISTVTVILQPPRPERIGQRSISEEIAEKCGIDDGQAIACSADIFDRWYSSLCFGLRHTLPKRVYTLKKSPGALAEYRDNGIPPMTIQSLLETYCLSQFMNTTDVSDMILDQILKGFQGEKRLYAKYKGRGRICEDDPNDVVRFMDLSSEDIEKLWLNTNSVDPIRKLLVDLFTYGHNSSKTQVDAAIRSRRRACELYTAFAQKYHSHNIIDDFTGAMYAEQFCATYHNHADHEQCYAWRTPSAQSKKLIDDTTMYPSTQSLEIEGVTSCQVPNNTGRAFDICDYESRHPELDWKTVCSFSSLIVFPSTEGPQRREPRPIFVDRNKFDADGRWPTHPGYNKPDWKADIEEDDEDEDDYRDDWNMAKNQDIPHDTTNRRTDEEGRVTFEIPDEAWYPPPDFHVWRKREPDETYSKWQSRRRDDWVDCGHALPFKRCVRFRPFEGTRHTLSTDPFSNRKPQMTRGA